jgi:TrkA domain protein
MNIPSEPITEQDLPGIGRRYQLNDDAGHVVTIIVHHSGRRDLYLAPPGRGELDAASFTDDQARRVGAILAGVYFKPAAVAQVEAVIGGLLIDWVTLHDRSPGVGRSIAELEVGDRLVVIGRPEDLSTFLSVVVT